MACKQAGEAQDGSGSAHRQRPRAAAGQCAPARPPARRPPHPRSARWPARPPRARMRAARGAPADGRVPARVDSSLSRLAAVCGGVQCPACKHGCSFDAGPCSLPAPIPCLPRAARKRLRLPPPQAHGSVFANSSITAFHQQNCHLAAACAASCQGNRRMGLVDPCLRSGRHGSVARALEGFALARALQAALLQLPVVAHAAAGPFKQQTARPWRTLPSCLQTWKALAVERWGGQIYSQHAIKLAYLHQGVAHIAAACAHSQAATSLDRHKCDNHLTDCATTCFYAHGDSSMLTQHSLPSCSGPAQGPRLYGGQLRAVHLAPLPALVALRPLVLSGARGGRVKLHQRAACAARNTCGPPRNARSPFPAVLTGDALPYMFCSRDLI